MEKRKKGTGIKRVLATVIAMSFGAIIFYLLLMAGQKGKGPLDNLAENVARNVAKLEKRWAGQDGRELRSEKLEWFIPYRGSKIRLNNIDTILLGIYDDSTYNSYEPVVQLEEKLNSVLPILHIYTAWGSQRDQFFPQLRVQAIYDLGSVPLITWEPWLNDFDPSKYPITSKIKNANEGGLQRIASGFYDAFIDQWALEAKSFRRPILVRFAHEMNDPYRYPWGPQNNTPEAFVAAWRYVVDRFRAAGADNVSWIWSPHPSYKGFMDYFPGADYIDWIGSTVLNYGNVAPWSQWWSFDDTFGKAYQELEQLDKPIMITELGCLDIGGNRAQWFQQALDSLPVKYPAVKSVLFFHVGADNTTTYKTLDWTLRQDTATLSAIRNCLMQWKKFQFGKMEGK
jgi:hypothetical protein